MSLESLYLLHMGTCTISGLHIASGVDTPYMHTHTNKTPVV